MRFTKLGVAALVWGLLLTACGRDVTGTRSVTELRAAGGVYTLPAIDAYSCRYGGEYPNCAPPPTGDPGYGGPETQNPGVEPSPPGAGGSYPPPDSTEEDKPCNTEDPVLNSLAVQAGLNNLWDRSNSGADMAQRLEKGGWLVQNASGGYDLLPFTDAWTIGPCGIDPPAGTVPPAGSVGWVHTHPYGTNDLLTSCEGTLVVIGGQTFDAKMRYGNLPSDADGMASTTWNLPGYVIDKQKITKFVGDPNASDKYRVLNQTRRCGY
jgi:hypothetical protein